eukprot:5510218-Lingulodinium_polyedra.AAC.1
MGAAGPGERGGRDMAPRRPARDGRGLGRLLVQAALNIRTNAGMCACVYERASPPKDWPARHRTRR